MSRRQGFHPVEIGLYAVLSAGALAAIVGTCHDRRDTRSGTTTVTAAELARMGPLRSPPPPAPAADPAPAPAPAPTGVVEPAERTQEPAAALPEGAEDAPAATEHADAGGAPTRPEEEDAGAAELHAAAPPDAGAAPPEPPAHPAWLPRPFPSDPTIGAGRFLTEAPWWGASSMVPDPDAGAGPFTTESNTPAVQPFVVLYPLFYPVVPAEPSGPAAP
jgi:hypothetical protein